MIWGSNPWQHSCDTGNTTVYMGLKYTNEPNLHGSLQSTETFSPGYTVARSGTVGLRTHIPLHLIFLLAVHSFQLFLVCLAGYGYSIIGTCSSYEEQNRKNFLQNHSRSITLGSVFSKLIEIIMVDITCSEITQILNLQQFKKRLTPLLLSS